MKIINLEVKGLFEVLDHLGVEKRVGALVGVHRAEANPASGSVSVHYDPSVTSKAALRKEVRDCGYHCRGEMVPTHVCRFAEGDQHAAHAKHAAQPGAKDEMAHEAQNSKAPPQMLADRASQWLVLIAIVIGVATFVIWLWVIGQTLLLAVTLTITVFVIACPDALGLATPMAIMIGMGRGAQNGILIKNASALEDSTRLDVVIFDKTGTLTLGKPEVVEGLK